MDEIQKNSVESISLADSVDLRSEYTFVHMARTSQIPLLNPSSLSYGGELLKTRKGRKHGRAISDILYKFLKRFKVQVHSVANVGNHLHFHIKVSRRRAYISFVRAITSAIRMAIAGHPRWEESPFEGKFWDYRPFSRVVQGRKAFLNLEDYITINRMEGLGLPKSQARLLLGHIHQRKKKLNPKNSESFGNLPLIC
ncbi:MAG TPA: hypothetical protein DCL41_06275 [Bdellovibrionales bacterium]|nr:hypothetical protein [Pseudobdellovibrionaceae bacterium]HAG91456.1 hypothetical protein [Bdellovibrionales bacterium]